MLFFIRKETVHVAEVRIRLFTGLQKDTRSWCQIGIWKPLDGDTRIALRHSEKEVAECCSAANVATLAPIAKMELDPLERFYPVRKIYICVKNFTDFFELETGGVAIVKCVLERVDTRFDHN